MQSCGSNSKFCCVICSYLPVTDFAFPHFCDTVTKISFLGFVLLCFVLFSSVETQGVVVTDAISRKVYIISSTLARLVESSGTFK